MTLDVQVRGELVSFTMDQVEAELREGLENKPIVVQVGHRVEELKHRTLELRLCKLIDSFPREATKLDKRAVWIQPDLTLRPSSFFGRLFWIVIRHFPFLRSKWYGIELDQTREFLHQLQPQCTAPGRGELDKLFGAAVGIFNQIAPKHDIVCSNQQEIHQVIDGGNIERLRELISPQSIEARNDLLRSPLHHAVLIHGTRGADGTLRNRLDIIQALLLAGANPEARDYKGKTPLFHAKSADVASLLINNGAKVDTRSLDRSTPLHFTPFEVSEVLLKHHADPVATNNRQCQPLHYVDSAEKAELLVDAGADPNARCEEKSTPLHYIAVRKGDPEGKNVKAVIKLLELGAQIEARNSKKQTPLFMARLQPQLAQELIDSGANPRATDISGYVPRDASDTPYERSRTNALIYQGDVPTYWKKEKTEQILTDLANAQKGKHWIRDDLTVVPYSRITHFFWSLAKWIPWMRVDDLERAKEILHQLRPQTLAHNELYESARKKFNEMIPHHAVVLDQVDTVHADFLKKIQLYAKVNPDEKQQTDHVNELLETVKKKVTRETIHVRDASGDTLLHHAVKLEGSALPLIEHLLLLGANVNARNKLGQTPLHGIHDLKVLEKLHESGGNILATDVEGRIPLYYTNSKACTQYYLAKGKTLGKKLVNFRDQSDQTPLHCCEWKDKHEKLLESGANPAEIDFFGDTPLHLKQDYDCCVQLVDKMASMDVKNRRGETPLHCVSSLYQQHRDQQARQKKKAQLLIDNGANKEAEDNMGNRPEVLKLLSSDSSSSNF